MERYYYKDILNIQKVDYRLSIGEIVVPWFRKPMKIQIFTHMPYLLYHPEVISPYRDNPGVFLPEEKDYFTKSDYFSYCEKCDYTNRMIELEGTRSASLVKEVLNVIEDLAPNLYHECIQDRNSFRVRGHVCEGLCQYFCVRDEARGESIRFYEECPNPNADRWEKEVWHSDHPTIIKSSNPYDVALTIIKTLS